MKRWNMRYNTFSIIIRRPSITVRFKYLIQRSASSAEAIFTKANPRDSFVRGSTTIWQSSTYIQIQHMNQINQINRDLTLITNNSWIWNFEPKIVVCKYANQCRFEYYASDATFSDAHITTKCILFEMHIKFNGTITAKQMVINTKTNLILFSHGYSFP